ncbi:MAG: acetate kinase, partial [Beggiatoa sp. IS2]
MGNKLAKVYSGGIFGIGGIHTYFVAFAADGTRLNKQDLPPPTEHENSFAVLLEWLDQRENSLEIVAVGHRIVHGGGVFTKPVRIDAAVIEQLEQLIPLAPLHQPHNVALVKILQKLQPQLPQIACFDNAFHSTMPPVACHFALPRDLTAAGIRRYGFHGLSYEYIVQVLPTIIGYLPERVIIAHLGNGVSLCALKGGRSIATTMGFTPLDGIPMGTRPGTL